MWRDHPFSQRNRTTDRTLGGWGLEVTGKLGGGAWTKFEKRGVGNIGGGLHKIGWLAPYLPTV